MAEIMAMSDCTSIGTLRESVGAAAGSFDFFP